MVGWPDPASPPLRTQYPGICANEKPEEQRWVQPTGAGASHHRAHQGFPLAALLDELPPAGSDLDAFVGEDPTVTCGRCLNTVGWHHAQLGDFQRALEYCQLALALLEELDHRNGQADTLDSLGYAYLRLGRPDQAVLCYQRALDLYRSLGDRHKEANTLECLGDTHQAAGESELAATAWQQAIEIFEDLGHAVTDDLRAKVAQGR